MNSILEGFFLIKNRCAGTRRSNEIGTALEVAFEQSIAFMSDAFQLTGTLHLPDASHPPVVIGCHGLFADRNSPKQIALARACNREGFAYFRFDQRGCGDSQGEFLEVTSLESRCRDLRYAIRTMDKHSGVGRLACLFGSSFGGSVVIAHAAEHPSPMLVTYAAPIESASIQQTNIRDNTGQPPRSNMLTEALEFDLTPKLASISNILIAHCQSDETVPAAHARLIHRLAGDPKLLLLFENGDHRMSNPSHQKEFTSLFIQKLNSDLA